MCSRGRSIAKKYVFLLIILNSPDKKYKDLKHFLSEMIISQKKYFFGNVVWCISICNVHLHDKSSMFCEFEWKTHKNVISEYNPDGSNGHK